MSAQLEPAHAAFSSQYLPDPPSSQPALSSPCGPTSSGAESRRSSGRPKKHPSVTPNSFRRFFTPRSLLRKTKRVSGARRALQEITNSRNERKCAGASHAFEPFPDIKANEDENADAATAPLGKRRKVYHSFEPPSSSISEAVTQSAQDCTEFPIGSSQKTALLSPVIFEDECEDEDPIEPPQLRRVQRYNGRSVGARILQQSLGYSMGRSPVSHRINWQGETASFYSGAGDSDICLNEHTSEGVLPFCVASCNTNSLVAIGDELGDVRLMETAQQANHQNVTWDPFLKWRQHSNAILDMSFSYDDLLLATASGDQTANIIDMPTQRTICTLSKHISSVKQVRFQPGQNSKSVIATSSRDGSIMIWDLRCNTGGEVPVRTIDGRVEDDGITGSGGCGSSSNPGNPLSATTRNRTRPVSTIQDAHADRRSVHHPASVATTRPLGSASDAAKTDITTQTRRADVSVTSLAFLSGAGREHILLTASEANARIKLWDLRNLQVNRRTNRAMALSTTQQPLAHQRHREYGINSLALSTDGGRLYSLCRDNTVYAYSTNHLILGHAPELSCLPASSSSSSSSRQQHRWESGARGGGREGLGPLYGFRHPKLYSTSFYVKMSLRKTSVDQTELLAVGSSDACAVLFPTDESHLESDDDGQVRQDSLLPQLPPSATTTPPTSSRLSSRVSRVSASLEDSIPIYGHHGTPLVRGHDREVTSLGWTAEGGLVTVGDDFVYRCWREDRARARDLRRGGEGEGRRWRVGWAEVGRGYDTEDDGDDDD